MCHNMLATNHSGTPNDAIIFSRKGNSGVGVVSCIENAVVRDEESVLQFVAKTEKCVAAWRDSAEHLNLTCTHNQSVLL